LEVEKMARHKLREEVDPDGFEAKLASCSNDLHEIIAYLRTSALHAGENVVARRFCHPAPNSGWGVTYYTRSTPFCEIHPKPQEHHAWVRLLGVEPASMGALGFEPSKQEGWFKVRGLTDAVRFVPWILASHDGRRGAVSG
jgi:hypothetical protein